MIVRTRFAPSPTGCLHLGAVRTALYSWLFARKNNGKFLLRIEDSDLYRSVKKNVDIIINELKWLGLDWDEGPYFQTNRLNRYNAVIEAMLRDGRAYLCCCSKERLRVLREEQIASGNKPKYDGFCRYKNLYKNSYIDSCVVRFRNPKSGLVVFDDQIRGPIIFKNEELDDLIIRRSDGNPTYNFCVIVDDMDMGITHVIRGEDHISNTPRQINILRSLNVPIPKYAHLSIILGDNGKKLSKRHCKFGITHYRDNGFLPEALLNFLIRLGWSHGDQEIFNISDVKNTFDLESINISSSIFDIKKLLWLNHYYINHLSLEYLSYHLECYMKQRNINYQVGPPLTEIIKYFGKRYKTLKDIVDNCYYFYNEFFEYDYEVASKYLSVEVVGFFRILRFRLEHLSIWTYESVHSVFFSVISELKTSINQVGMSLRVAITGMTKSPELVAVLYIFGQKHLLNRLDMAVDYIIGHS